MNKITLDFNPQRGVDGSIDVAELHLVSSSVLTPLDVPHHQVGVALRVLDDYLVGGVQGLLAVEPHDLRNGASDVDNMESEAGP